MVVLSQACDLEHGKIDSVVLSPVWTLNTLIENNNYYRGSNARESLRQGKEPAYHLVTDGTGAGQACAQYQKC